MAPLAGELIRDRNVIFRINCGSCPARCGLVGDTIVGNILKIFKREAKLRYCTMDQENGVEVLDVRERRNFKLNQTSPTIFCGVAEGFIGIRHNNNKNG